MQAIFLFARHLTQCTVALLGANKEGDAAASFLRLPQQLTAGSFYWPDDLESISVSEKLLAEKDRGKLTDTLRQMTRGLTRHGFFNGNLNSPYDTFNDFVKVGFIKRSCCLWLHVLPLGTAQPRVP